MVSSSQNLDKALEDTEGLCYDKAYLKSGLMSLHFLLNSTGEPIFSLTCKYFTVS